MKIDPIAALKKILKKRLATIDPFDKRNEKDTESFGIYISVNQMNAILKMIKDRAK